MTTIKPTQRDRDAAAAYWGNNNPPLELVAMTARHAAAERAMERAAIVEWLRGGGFVRDFDILWRKQLTDAIEAGEHLSDNAEAIERGE
jgi:hypothetical protein